MPDNSNSKSPVPDRKFFTGAPLLGMVVLIVALVGLAVDSIGGAGPDNFFADVTRMDNVAVKIHQSYVEEVSSKDLIDNAIKGMMQILDPHTSYYEAKEYETLRMQTEGKFGGLGIQISIRDKVLTVMTPISGTPAYRAGIQSGDQIIRIDGVSTRGITTDVAVTKLRGEPGTDVRILIRRKGEPQDEEYIITREIIHLKSVPFYGVLQNGIGYITLQQFSQEAGAEVERAIRELKRQNIRGLIFDLRHNPGGLLPQAIEVSGKFLPRGSLVVSTRGRMRNQNKDFLSHSPAVLSPDIPLVVLVDRASASASEIVAGAVQDWDRGVILGDTTFGKGSVQSILQLDATNHLKLTTAFYYTPAGRCINRPENLVRGTDRDAVADDDEDEEGEEGDGSGEEAGDSKAAAPADTAVYRTKGGRKVFGGGGIVPDTVVARRIPEAAVRALLLRDMFFRFANEEYVRLQMRGIRITKDYRPDQITVDAFFEYLESAEFTYKSAAQLQFHEFKKRSGIIEDTASGKNRNPFMEPPQFSEIDLNSLRAASETMDSILAADSRRSIKQNKPEIKRLIRNALLIREFGQDHEAVFRARLANDEQLAAAIGLLKDKEAYARLLRVPSEAPSQTVAPTPEPAEEPSGRRNRRRRQ